MSGSRPSSITRSIRDSFTPEMECLPPEIGQDTLKFEFCEEIEDLQNIEVYEEDTNNVKRNNLDSSQSAKKDGLDKSRLKSSKSSKSSKSTTLRTEDDSEDIIDPKIRKGLDRIQKLDKILQTKMELEREVKRERLALEKTFLRQVQTLIEEKGSENVAGYQQLMCLCAPTDRDDVVVDETAHDDTVQPIFATQIDDSNYYSQEPDKISVTEEVGGKQSNTKSKDKQCAAEKGMKSSKKRKDFIQRNIKLASLASETIALTDEEKKRLEELLDNDSDLLIGDNPFSTPIIKDGGFCFSIEEQKTLESIDERLKEFVPVDVYETILSQSQSSISLSEQSVKSCTTTSTSTGNEQIDELTRGGVDVKSVPDVECGEQVLREEHQKRTMVQRLNDIERKLQELRNNIDDSSEEGVTACTIDPDLLRQLLDTNSRLTSSSKSICESFRTNSIIYDNEDDIDICSIVSQSLTITSVEDDVESESTAEVIVNS